MRIEVAGSAEFAWSPPGRHRLRVPRRGHRTGSGELGGSRAAGSESGRVRRGDADSAPQRLRRETASGPGPRSGSARARASCRLRRRRPPRPVSPRPARPRRESPAYPPRTVPARPARHSRTAPATRRASGTRCRPRCSGRCPRWSRPGTRRRALRRVHLAADQAVDRLHRVLKSPRAPRAAGRGLDRQVPQGGAARGRRVPSRGDRPPDRLGHPADRGLGHGRLEGGRGERGVGDGEGSGAAGGGPSARRPRSKARPRRRPPPAAGRSRPAGAAPARRRCCDRAVSSVLSHRSASSNLSSRSLMSASAFRAITFSPSSDEHVEERGFGRVHVAQVHVAAAQDDARGDVVGMDAEARGPAGRARASPHRSSGAPRRAGRR